MQPEPDHIGKIIEQARARAGREETAETLLLEWFAQWYRRDDMPAKMDDALHMRTVVFLMAASPHPCRDCGHFPVEHENGGAGKCRHCNNCEGWR